MYMRVGKRGMYFAFVQKRKEARKNIRKVRRMGAHLTEENITFFSM